MCVCARVCVYMLVHVRAATVIVYKQIWYHHYLGKQWGVTKHPESLLLCPGVQTEF